MFFAMPIADGKMKNIVLNYHILKLNATINKYESRLIKPDPVL